MMLSRRSALAMPNWTSENEKIEMKVGKRSTFIRPMIAMISAMVMLPRW